MESLTPFYFISYFTVADDMEDDFSSGETFHYGSFGKLHLSALKRLFDCLALDVEFALQNHTACCLPFFLFILIIYMFL